MCSQMSQVVTYNTHEDTRWKRCEYQSHTIKLGATRTMSSRGRKKCQPNSVVTRSDTETIPSEDETKDDTTKWNASLPARHTPTAGRAMIRITHEPTARQKLQTPMADRTTNWRPWDDSIMQRTGEERNRQLRGKGNVKRTRRSVYQGERKGIGDKPTRRERWNDHKNRDTTDRSTNGHRNKKRTIKTTEWSPMGPQSTQRVQTGTKGT